MNASLDERRSGVLDRLRTTFGFPAGVAMLLGLLLGLGLPSLDDLLELDLPLFVFSTQDAARSLLETISTVTVAVAGLAFSVTIVAFTLSANQLSPRVLRSFRRDRLSQITLAAFLGTFIYCLWVLVRLGTLGPDRVPNLSITFAVLLALVSFGLFVAFVGHIAEMLQPSTVIASIDADARGIVKHPYPHSVGEEPDDPARARAEAEPRMRAGPPTPVRGDAHGYLTLVRGGEVLSLAEKHDGLVRQRKRVGDYVLPHDVLAEVWAPSDGEAGELAQALRPAFELGSQRTLPQDPLFPVRQLVDVALKGLSPGINDPTTAENAMDAAAAGIIRFARSRRPCPVRVDAQGRPRFVTDAPELDDLVRLGFGQVADFASSDPTTLATLLRLLDRIVAVAAEEGHPRTELERQSARVRERLREAPA